MGNLVWGKMRKLTNLHRAGDPPGPAMKSHKVTQTADSHCVLAQAPTITHNEKPQTITHIGHNDEKISLVLFLASGFAIWNMF